MEETITCGIRTVVVYGPSGQQHQTRSVRCPAGNGTMDLAHCEACAARAATVASDDTARAHMACRVEEGHPARRVMVSELMPRTVVAVCPDLRSDVLLLALVEHDRGGAPVVNEVGRPIGMVSITDLLEDHQAMQRAADGPADPPGRPRLVKDVMSLGAYTIHESACPEEALAELTRRNVKRLMVVGDGGELVGVVTALDLLRACPAVTRRSSPAVAKAHPDRFHREADPVARDARQEASARMSA